MATTPTTSKQTLPEFLVEQSVSAKSVTTGVYEKETLRLRVERNGFPLGQLPAVCQRFFESQGLAPLREGEVNDLGEGHYSAMFLYSRGKQGRAIGANISVWPTHAFISVLEF